MVLVETGVWTFRSLFKSSSVLVHMGVSENRGP